MTTRQLDVVVLGTGSAAERLAPQLVKGGRSVAVVEGHLVGGECPFLACMPSKSMLHSATARSQALAAAREGLVEPSADDPQAAAGDPDRAYARAAASRERVTRGGDDSGHVSSLREQGVEVVRGWGRVSGPGSVQVSSEQEPTGVELRWEHLVLAGGAKPSLPPVEGLAEVPYLTSDQAWNLPARPTSMAILGGGPVGCELAQAFARFDVDVTLIEDADRLLPNEDATAAELLRRALERDGIAVRTGTRASAAREAPGGIELRLEDGAVLTAATLVVATGRTPWTDDIGLDRLGIEPAADGALRIDDRCRVIGAERVWAAGDITGVAPFTHTANYQADVLADNLLGGDRRADYRAIPRAVYTDPSLAAVGLTEQQADAEGIRVTTATVDLGDTARSAFGNPTGVVRLLADPKRGVLVGATVVAPGGGELIGEMALAVRAEVPLRVLAEVVHPFPTFSQAWEQAIAQLVG